jgi:hypothetical protein
LSTAPAAPLGVADHLRELPVRASICIDAHKRERLRRQLGHHFKLERGVRISDRVRLPSHLVAASDGAVMFPKA